MRWPWPHLSAPRFSESAAAMKNDDPSAEKSYPLAGTKLSKTPSWIMLGFALGAAFVLALPPLRKPPAAPPAPVATPVERAPPAGPRDPPLLTTIEALFAEEEKYAVWSDDVTEVALWNKEDKGFTEFYEVRRSGAARYFRSIPTLTRRVIERGKPRPGSPLQFTESEEQYRDWLQHGRTERVPLLDFRPVNRAPPPAPVRPPTTTVPQLPPPELTPIAPQFNRPPPEKK